MNIHKEIKNNSIELKVEGRLDTTNYTQLQNVVDGLGHFDELTFDFSELEYISSSGLRVILSAQKKANANKAKMIIKNLNNLVAEIFEMVGFTEFINIR